MAQHFDNGTEQTPAATGTMLSIVIPALNEEDGITEICDKCLAIKEALKAVGVTDLEVIVVDDGSTDRTPEIVSQMEGVRLIKHKVNRGYGAAIKTGFGHAQGDLLAFLDADSTYPPEFMPKLCDIAIRGGADVVIGSRRAGAASSMPPIRRLGNFIWSNLLSLIGGEKVQDPASGMRVFWRRCTRQLYPLPDGLNFTPVMSTRALHEGLKVVEYPITYKERAGRSKLSVVRDGLRFLGTILWTASLYNPARLLELVGFAALIVTGLIGLGMVAARMNGVIELGTWGVLAVYLCLVMAVSGIGAFSLGITFNRLVALFHRNPVRQPSLLGKVLGSSPQRHFRWMGTAAVSAGLVLGGITMSLGLQGWDMRRLWLWLLGSALLVLVGIQLTLFWTLIRVLDTLLEREGRIEEELRTSEAPAYGLPAAMRAAASGTRG
ncbi:MAG: glycosyltransferase family 2 protein [Acidobacteriota bacterium]